MIGNTNALRGFSNREYLINLYLRQCLTPAAGPRDFECADPVPAGIAENQIRLPRGAQEVKQIVIPLVIEVAYSTSPTVALASNS